MKRIGILYHPHSDKARALARELQDALLASGVAVWQNSAWEETVVRSKMAGSDLLISVGGDGTLLRVARATIPDAVPVLGVNLGKVGFLVEVDASQVGAVLPRVLGGEGWIEKRAVLEARFKDRVFHGVNDAVVARGSVVRAITVEAMIDGQMLSTYSVDGVVVATATGSTAYSLALGGPVLHPEARELVFKAIAPYLGLDRALVLPESMTVTLKVLTTHEARLSLDGQVEIPLANNDKVVFGLSKHQVHFLRLRPRSYLYSLLEAKLGGQR